MIKSFWGVHVPVLAEIFAQRWAVSLSQRLATEAIGMQRQPWSTWIFLMKMNRLTALDWSPTTIAVPFRFQVTLGLKLALHRGREGSKIDRREVIDDEGDDGDDPEVCVHGGACGGRDVRRVWRRTHGQQDVGDESVEQEGLLGEGLADAEVEHKIVEEALVAETLLMGTQPTWAATTLNHSPGTLWILENLNDENLFHWDGLVPITHDIVNLKGNSIFSSSNWNKLLKLLQGPQRNMRPKT